MRVDPKSSRRRLLQAPSCKVSGTFFRVKRSKLACVTCHLPSRNYNQRVGTVLLFAGGLALGVEVGRGWIQHAGDMRGQLRRRPAWTSRRDQRGSPSVS